MKVTKNSAPPLERKLVAVIGLNSGSLYLPGLHKGQVIRIDPKGYTSSHSGDLDGVAGEEIYEDDSITIQF